MALSNNDYTRLQEALKQAFPTPNALDKMLQEQLGKSIHDVAANEALPEIIRRLVHDWAAPAGKIVELTIRALKQQPGNKYLQHASLMILIAETDLTSEQLIASFRQGLPGEFERIDNGRLRTSEEFLKLLLDLKGNRLLLRFVNHLGSMFKDHCVHDYIREWFECIAAHKNFNEPWTGNSAAPSQQPYQAIAIILIPSNNQQEYIIRILGRLVDEYKKIDEVEVKPKTGTDIEYGFLLKRLGHIIWNTIRIHSHLDKVPVEFFLPEHLMALAVDQIILDDDEDENQAAPLRIRIREKLCYQHPVLIRSHHRGIYQVYHGRAEDRWKHMQTCNTPNNNKKYHLVFESLDSLDGLQKKLESKSCEYLVCIGLCHLPSETENLLTFFQAIIKSGIPIAIWTRQPNSRRSLHKLIKAGGITGLPEYIHQQQRAGCNANKPHIGQHLGLMWDDPTLKPEHPLLEYPKYK